MRLTLVVPLLLLAGCASPKMPHTISNPEGLIVEETILWQAELDPVTWTPIEMAQLVSDEECFTEEDNFYKVHCDLTVFGHQALYLGTIGVNGLPGFTAALQGSPASIAKHITQHRGIIFLETPEGYSAQLKDDIALMVAEHPDMKGASIVLGAYMGQ